MMKKNDKQTVPELRFRGFTDPWEQRQLGELYSKNTERNQNRYDARKTLSVSSMTFNPSGNGASDESLTTYKVLRVGDAAFEGHTSNEFAFGRFVVNTTGNGIMSPRFAAIRPTSQWRQSCDLNFWAFYLHDEGVMKHILVRSTKRGTMMNELVFDDFFAERIRVPSLPEQHRIGDFFSALDNLIAAAERQEALLRQKKQAYLQLMFPQEGETEPRLRFAGFNGEWEQRQLGEVAVRRSVQAVSSKDMPAVEYEDVEAGRGTLATAFTFKEGKSGIRFEPGDVLYGKLRPYLGNRLKPDFRGVAIGDWWVLAPSNVASSFLFSLIQSPRFVTVANQSSGSKMPRADWKLVGSAAFGIPTLPEQHRIGEFFSTLDNLIATAEQQSESLRALKSAYLQRMFV